MGCCQDRLTAAIQSKQELRVQVEKQLGQEMGKFRDLEKEAAEALLRARHSSGKLMVGSSCSSMCCCAVYACCRAVACEVL